MIKVGIIGCGRIADSHAASVDAIPGSQIVATCDSEELMAKQLQERTGADHCFTDAARLAEAVDVVHITTPPASHFELGKLCLDAGCHVYIEKPFAVTGDESDELIRLAEEKKKNVTVGHNAQFTHAAVRMRELVQSGYLGGAPIHMEASYCYDLSDARYAKALLGDSNHWVRKLPGKLLHNIVSHGVSKVAEFLKSDRPKVIAHGFTSPILTEIGETDIVDELRVIIEDGGYPTAYFTFSTQMNPVLHELRLYGPKNSLIVDDDHQSVIKVRGGKYKSYLNHFVPPWVYAKQYLSNWSFNTKKFLTRDFHMTHGMTRLIRLFHQSIAEDGPPPIPPAEIVRTARIMDSIFEQLNRRSDV